ncbi:MAG: hypothetical protein AUJ12_07720 [Alphaproteobacteria bacterium CG1_02_46_17]|nr:MAG: hypothetical protein AUJ12_07720 [Alphaproteobacteria bacterium CG1_02_46_17]
MSALSFLNKTHILTNLERAKRHLQNPATDDKSSDFLLRWAEQEMMDRLADIKKDFPRAALISISPSDNFIEHLEQRCSHLDIFKDISPLDIERIPFDPETYDLVIDFFDIHKINDLPGWLVQIRHVLKEDGVFMACYAGENTLFQLRQTLLAAEMKVMGGASPRILPFVSKQQMSSLLQRAGYTLPVVDSETVTVIYHDIYRLMNDIRHMGEANSMTERFKFFTPSRLFFEAATIYKQRFAEEDGRLPATFDISFIIGWSPSDTQQKPLRRGSGQVPLSSILE